MRISDWSSDVCSSDLSTAMDDVAAAREIAEHVVGLGHRTIAIIMGDPAHAASAQRLVGYRQAFDAIGLSQRPELVETGDFSFESGYEATKRLLSRKLRPTAILAQNDDMAVDRKSTRLNYSHYCAHRVPASP